MIVSSLTKTKSYLTGGFRSAEGMIRGLETLDGVGLARPLCQEPFLCRDILHNKIPGSLTLAMNEYDFGLTAGAAIVHIRQMGQGLQPVDLSTEEGVNAMAAALVGWSRLRATDRSEAAIQAPCLDGYAAALKVEA